MDDKMIKRINELAGKSKETGLSPEEKEEQASLREAYLKEFRKNLRSGLENITIEYPDGRKVNVKDLRRPKEDR